MDEIFKIVSTISGRQVHDIRLDETLAELGLSSSIKLYRLQYAIEAALGKEIKPLSPGFTIDSIASMAGLSQEEYLDGSMDSSIGTEYPEEHPAATATTVFFVGIDIEEIAGFPKTSNYRGHPFYNRIFTNEEISYALVHKNPLEHFCGMFCAKEALKKTAPPFSILKMSEIRVGHEGYRPFIITTHQELNQTYQCQVSISHADHYAVATVLAVMKSSH